MKTLSIDIETYSDQPLAKTGVYRYVESPIFEILLFSYSVDGGRRATGRPCLRRADPRRHYCRSGG